MGMIQEVAEGVKKLAAGTGASKQALKRSRYASLIEKRLKTGIPADKLHKHLFKEELARRELLEDLQDTTQAPEETAHHISKQVFWYSDSHHSWAEGVLCAGIMQLFASLGMNLYFAITELIKRKATTGSYFK